MEAFFNHLNPGIITSVMSKMNQQEFIECAKFIKQQALNLPPGTKRQMYVRLFNWCTVNYRKKFQSKPNPQRTLH